MNGYETVYTPADSKTTTHVCRPKERNDWSHEVKHPRGTIVCCDKCGQHWFAYLRKYGEVYTTKWYKVRWFHYGKKRRILGK